MGLWHVITTKMPWYRSFLFAALTLVVLSALVSVFYYEGIASRKEALNADFDSITSAVNARIKSHAEFIAHIADEYGDKQLEEKFFRKKVGKFGMNHAELMSTGILLKEGTVLWVAPRSLEHNRSYDLSQPPLRDVFTEVFETEATSYSEPYIAFNGDAAVAIAIPVVRNLSIVGAVISQVSLERLFQSAIKADFFQKYRIELLADEGGTLVDFADLSQKISGYAKKQRISETMAMPIMRIARYQGPINWVIITLILISTFLTFGLAWAIWILGKDNYRRKLVQLELERAKDAAEQANKAKSQLIANISHEIRTPLGAIQGYADLIKNFSQTKDEQMRSVVAIQRNSRHLLSLINGLLDLSKIEAGLLEVERQEFSVLDAIHEAMDLVRLNAEKKGLKLSLHFDSSFPEKIWSDAMKFKQILTNLLSNAVKFTEAGAISVVVNYRKPYLKILVKDPGIGMSEQQLQRLFKPFSQGDASISRKYGGTGLGLTLSRTFAELLGGELVLILSKPGQGSTFLVKLQVELSQEVRMISGTLASAGTAPVEHDYLNYGLGLEGKGILIVEDCHDNQVIYSSFLRPLGAEVALASSGREALELSQQRTYDLVVMDVQMPEVDGYETTRALRRQGFKNPIIALTAHAMKGERERCLAAGCDAYLTKPITADTFLERIQSLILSRAEKVTMPSKMSRDPRVGPLLKGFVDGIPLRLTLIGAAVEGRRFQEVANLCHQLKGTALNYGYPLIAENAEKLESYATVLRPDSRQLSPLIMELSKQYDAALAAIK